MLAIIGGLVGIRQLLEYLQSNAEAQSDVKSLQRDLEKLTVRLTALESKVERLETDNTSLIEQNKVLLLQGDEHHLMNKQLIEQNTILVQMLQGSEEESE